MGFQSKSAIFSYLPSQLGVKFEFFMENGCRKYVISHFIATMLKLLKKYRFLGSRNSIKYVSRLNKQYFLTYHGNGG